MKKEGKMKDNLKMTKMDGEDASEDRQFTFRKCGKLKKNGNDSDKEFHSRGN